MRAQDVVSKQDIGVEVVYEVRLDSDASETVGRGLRSSDDTTGHEDVDRHVFVGFDEFITDWANRDLLRRL